MCLYPTRYYTNIYYNRAVTCPHSFELDGPSLLQHEQFSYCFFIRAFWFLRMASFYIISIEKLLTVHILWIDKIGWFLQINPQRTNRIAYYLFVSVFPRQSNRSSTVYPDRVTTVNTHSVLCDKIWRWNSPITDSSYVHSSHVCMLKYVRVHEQ